MHLRIFIFLICFSEIINLSAQEQKNVDGADSDKSNQNLYDYYYNKSISCFDVDSIIYYSELAIQVAKNNNLNPVQAITVYGLGNYQAGNLTKALDNYFIAADLYKSRNYNIGLATVYSYIANVYNTQNNFSAANKYNKLAIDIFKSEKDSLHLAYVLHNNAYNFYTQNYKLDSALLLYQQAKEIYQKLNLQREVAYCEGNAGLVFSKQKRYNLALSKLRNSLGTLYDEGDNFAIAEFMVEYAKILDQKGESDSALTYARECYDIAVKNNITERIRDASKCLANIYSEGNQYDSAYHYFTIYSIYNDSLKNIKTVQQMANLRTTYEVSQKQAEVDLLNRRKTFLLILAGALFLIIILAAGLIYMYYKNIKRIKKFSGALKEQSNELKNSNNVKDKFFSIISHDLRSPLSSLSAISMMINESLENNNRMLLEEASQYIDQTVYSLTGLLENLLNWAMSEQGKFPFKPEKIDTKELISEEVKMLSTVTLSKNLKLKLNLTDELFIDADKNSMKTILRNLLSNACKFTPKHGQIKISSELNKKKAVISIADNGVGIPPDKIKDIFKLKSDKSTRGTESEKGLGLGLTLIHEFVTKNKGKIDVTSEPGKGSTFTLYFPVQTDGK